MYYVKIIICEAFYYVKSTRTWLKTGRVSYEILIFPNLILLDTLWKELQTIMKCNIKLSVYNEWILAFPFSLMVTSQILFIIFKIPKPNGKLLLLSFWSGYLTPHNVHFRSRDHRDYNSVISKLNSCLSKTHAYLYIHKCHSNPKQAYNFYYN